MNVGFVGLGKLGLPVALAIESRGHEVYGTDPDPRVLQTVRERKLPYLEEGADALLATTKIGVTSLGDLVRRCDLLFVAVQTPHDPRFDGTTRLPRERADFDYSYLIRAVSDIADTGTTKPVAIISTVLPGTIERDILPLYPHLCYNPFFIAMGTTIQDFLHPEFVLLGGDAEPFLSFYDTIYTPDVGDFHYVERVETSILNAEIIKVTYNTFIGQKIVFGNAVMELCHKLGGDCDTVINALSLATDRLISPKYLRGGMGDGGACHPRDAIALSHLARQVGLSNDTFEQVMFAREQQTAWLATLIQQHRGNRPVLILGKAFKANTNITAGSAALLLANILDERGIPYAHFDREVDGYSKPVAWTPNRCIFIATAHDSHHQFAFQSSDIVLDPWRKYRDAVEAAGATYVPIGC